MKKLLLVLILVCPMLFSACSCSKYDINTYATAVDNYKYARGVKYELTITTTKKDSDVYEVEKSINTYKFDTIGNVEKFHSESKLNIVNKNGYNGVASTSPVRTTEMYYDGINFYLKNTDINGSTRIPYLNKSYDEMFPLTDRYNKDNIVPEFMADDISNFHIAKDEEKKGYSDATFSAACPSYLQCNKETITYKIKIDDSFRYNIIEFTVESGDETIEYKYAFLEYGSELEIKEPSDISQY